MVENLQLLINLDYSSPSEPPKITKKLQLKTCPPPGYSELLGDRHGPRRPAVHVVGDLEPAGTEPPLLTHQEVVKVFKAGEGLLG